MKNNNFSQKQINDGYGLSFKYPISIRIVKALSRTAALLTFLLTLGVGQMWAWESRTVYYAVPASTVACQTVYLNVNVGDNNTWVGDNMSKVGMWNNSGTDYVVYQGSFEERYSGVDAMQFQLKSNGVRQSQQQPISSWTGTDTYSGKMYVHDTGWRSYAVDAAVSYRIYFVNKDSWASRYTYAYYADCHNNWSWPGQSMTSASKQYNGKDIYYIDLSSPFPNVIFNNNSSETSSIACYSNRGKMYYDGSFITLQYDVTLDQQSGSDGTSSIIATCGSTMPGSKTAPSRTGYTFGGYYTSTEGGGTKYYNADMTSAATWPSDGSGPITLYAKWTAKNYNLTLNKNGGSSDGSVTATYNSSSLTSFSGASRTGYTCTGYYTANSGGSKIINANGTLPSSTVANYLSSGNWVGDTVTVLWAQWEVDSYTITLDKNGGDSDGSVQTTYASTTTSSLSAPTYSGYHVTGYYSAATSGTLVMTTAGVLQSSVSGFTDSNGKWTATNSPKLYAYWEEDAANYDVTFGVGTSYTSLGSLTATADASAISSGDDITAGSEVVFTASPNSYYEVAGFYSDASCTSSLQSGSSTTYTIASLGADATVYVKFQPITYTITYNLNGGSNGANPSSYTYESSKIDLADATKSGYTFGGWYANSDLSTGGVQTSIAAGSNGNKTFWAKWTENDYTVTVTAGSNGSVASGSVTGHKDTKVTLPAATANTGYHFDTWTTTSGSVTYTNETSATTAQVNGLTAAATVRADFAANTYEVAFNNNGGTGSMSNEAFTYDASAKALTTNTFTYTGYTFLGWATSTERATALTVDYTDGESVQNLTSANNGTYTLYAVWVKDYYIGGRFQHDWEEGDATTNKMTYDASTGYYKFETGKTVSELSEQWYNTVGNYDADQAFYIHTGKGKDATSSLPTYVGTSSNGHSMQVKIGYSNAYVLTAKTSSFGSFAEADLLKFTNTDNLSSDVIVWWDPANLKVWYTATESLNTNYYLLGFGEDNWSETDARRFTVASVNATTATVSVSLSATTYTQNTDDGFKVKNGSTYYGNNGTMTRANCTNWTFVTDNNNCGITADVAGTYTFTLNLSTKAVSVTYPTSYQLTYSVGDVAGNDGSISSDPSTSSGSYVISDGTVTLTAPDAKTGYTWKGWYANSDGSGDQLEDDAKYEITVSAATTVYACYTEDTYNVTVSNDGHGSVSPTGTVAVKQVSGTTLTATPSSYYIFQDWTISGGGITPTTSSTNPQVFKATETGGTIRANFKDQWCLAGGDATADNGDDLGDWSTDANPLAYTSGTTVEGTVSITTPGTYYIKVVDRTGSKTYYGKNPTTINRANPSANDLANDGGNITFVADVVGDYTFSYDEDGKDLTVTFPTAYTVTYGVGSVPGCASVTPTPSFSSGDYVAAATSVTFAKSATLSGYSWKGWYNNASGTGDAISTTDASYVSSSRAAAYTIYACFTEDKHTVTLANGGNGHVEISSSTVTSVSGVGIATASGTITAVPDNGYYFTGWTGDINNGVTLVTGSASTASITINATADSKTLTANFAPIWRILGSEASNTTTGTDGFGGWDTDNDNAAITHIGTNASSKDTGYVELTLEANKAYQFKMFKHDASGDARYYGNGGDKVYDMTYAGDHTDWGFGTDKSYNCGIVTAGAGTYKFAWNLTDKTLTVYFPTSYTVTFGQGTGNGTAVTASGSVSGSITTGQYVAAGENVTFTQTPATGYTFSGWYTTVDGNTTVTGMGTSDNVLDDIAANAAVYAQYTEDIHTVTVTADEHCTINKPVAPATTVSAGIATSAPIQVTADYGYYFSRWTVVSGSATFGDEYSASTTVKATADAVIKANIVSHWTIVGGDSENDENGADAMGNWNEYANGIEHFEQDANEHWIGYAEIDLPANTTFYFKVRDLYGEKAWYGNTGEMTYSGDHEDWVMSTDVSANCRITTAGKGTYRFTWDENDKKLTVTYPTSYTVTYSTYKFMGDDESNSESTTAGSISSVVDGDAIALTSGKYVVDGGTAVFTHSAATTDYHFAGWYSDAACTTAYVNGEGGAVINDGAGTLTLTIDDNTTVYAKFAENMTTINFAGAHGHVEIGGATVTSATAGTVTERTITAVPATGYYFAGWKKTACTDYAIDEDEDDEDAAEITLTGQGAGATSGQTLTANFVELEKVYFRNWNADNDEPLWENVYAYFSITFVDNCANSNSSSDYTAIEMQREGSSNVYWAYVPRGTTKNEDYRIAFSNHAFATNYKFHDYEAVKRADYKNALNMFVPQHSGNTTINDTKYYNGYWKHHNVASGSDAGYRIERYNGSSYETPADNGGDRLKFLVGDENTIIYSLRVDNLDDGYNNYMIYSVDSVSYITFDSSPVETGYTITTSTHSNIGLSEYNSGDPRFYITPTSEGIYTLTIDMSGDVMRLNVTYPVAVGDYQLVHSYNDGSAKISRSDVIKTSEMGERLYSMFIDNITAHTKSLKLKKCTSLSVGNPVWSEGTDVSMTGFKTDTAGVFQFNVAVATDNATLSNIEAYRGSYYIKTDCADGGWTAYHQNVLEHNTSTFDKAKSSTYDYYFCKYIGDARKRYGNPDNGENGCNLYDNGGTPTNVKFVIANDYCNAVSDTLAEDAITGAYQTLPMPGSVRFSYNSTTNDVKRTYLNGSSCWAASYLLLEGNHIEESSNDVYMIHSYETGNAYNTTHKDTTLIDANNWIYTLDIKARDKARIRLSAKFDNTVQSLIGTYQADGAGLSGVDNANTVQIIGGSTDDKTYRSYRIVYDFKTNKLVAGWLAGDVTNDIALYADIIVVRGSDQTSSASQITLNNKTISEVDTVYGVMQFNKSDILDGTKSRTERNTYWISFPFSVNLRDVFGFGEYGKHWILKYYDGARRAREGFWAESDGFWTTVKDPETFVMNATEGYVLQLSNSLVLNGSSHVWDNSVSSVSLYFPSNTKFGSITDAINSGTTTVTEHKCNIQRDNRYIWDSNWNLIGVPGYINLDGISDPASVSADRARLEGGQYPKENLSFYYTWDPSENTLNVEEVTTSKYFNSLYCYMVQFAGTINWSTGELTPPAIAARRIATDEEKDNYTLDLHVSQAGSDADHTYIRLQDNATESYDLNIDLVKAANAGATNLYTIVDEVNMGANCLPIPATTTIVPVGITAAANAEYTFSLPEGTDGMNVSLIDYATGEQTNLALGDYAVSLPQGTYDSRFALVINRRQVVTDIEATEGGMLTSGEEKVVIDGILYIRKDGMVFDAQGQRVR